MSLFQTLSDWFTRVFRTPDDQTPQEYYQDGASRKRRASQHLQRASKARRLSTPRPASAYGKEDDISDRPHERASSPLAFTSSGGQTETLQPSQRDARPSRRDSGYSIYSRPSRRTSGTPLERAAQQKIREKRLAWLYGDAWKKGAQRLAQMAEEDSELETYWGPVRIEVTPQTEEEEDIGDQSSDVVSSQDEDEDEDGRLVAAEWTTQPNPLARLIIREHPDDPLKHVMKAVGEPEYVIRDAEIRDAVWQIMDKMEIFAKDFFDFEFRDERRLTQAFASMDPATVKIIGYVASGGPGGEEGWRELFYNRFKRRALVCAIIGNVLVEQVFKHPCFGCTSQTRNRLNKVQKELKDTDGFTRKSAYAKILHDDLFPADSTALPLPPRFLPHATHILAFLTQHLYPILLLPHPLPVPITAPTDHIPRALILSLSTLVNTSALLSLLLQLDPHTVYDFPHSFKEVPFSPEAMDAVNDAAMRATNPRAEGTIFPEGTTQGEITRKKGDAALCQVCLMDGLVAWRKGGWERRGSRVWKPEYGAGMEERGVRCRRLVRGWVFCRWGRERVVDEMGRNRDRKEVHGAAWREPGFVEFREVRGVEKEVR